MNEIWDNKTSFVYTSERNADRSGFYRHTHNAFELYMFINGEADYVIEGAAYALKPRSFVFVKAMDYHFVNLKQGGVYERAVIHFEPNCGFDDLAASLKESFVLSPAYSDGVCEVMFKLKEAANRYDGTDGKKLLSAAITDMLLQLKYLEQPIRERQIVNDTACKAAEFINVNLDKPLKAEDVASALYLSPSYLAHVFKKHFKTSLMSYVREKKIRYACALLSEGQTPTDVCAKCGFTNYSTFYRLFLKYNGLPPSDKLRV